MATYHVLYHESNKEAWEASKNALKRFYPNDDLVFTNVLDIKDYKKLFADFEPADRIILVGGDGTLNRFINYTQSIDYKNEIYYYAAGTGNDFLRDIGGTVGEAPVQITKYLKKLPTVIVNGKSYKYLNGIGYGIDGYCCEIGDELHAKSDKPVNYTSIAIKGLLFHYNPTDAVVTVDGERYEYKKAWLAPTMNGRYYGGGMMATPKQDRLNPSGTQSVMLFYGKGRLTTLIAFPKIFSGEHVSKTNMVAIHTGKHIKVEFSSPRALQIDGETIKGVSSYEVISE